VCRRHSTRRGLFIFLTSIVVLCLLITSGLPFNAHSTTASAASSLIYDFVARAADASWSSEAGNLPFPCSDSDSRGFALYRNNYQLEDNSTCTRALETHPQWISNGWIMGTYPQMTVPANAELDVTVGFFKGASQSDGVVFGVKFQEFLGLTVAPRTHSIIAHKATYDGKMDSVARELSSLQGKTGNFILYVEAGQSSGQDWAAWAKATIEAPSDNVAPEITIRHSPSEVTTTDAVTFTARARDSNNIASISIFVDGEQIEECSPPVQKIDGDGGKYWECTCTAGPYDEGAVTYRAEASDIYNNRGVSGEESLDVALVISQFRPPVTPCFFSITGTIHDFPYPEETLKVQVCEAETIMSHAGDTMVPVTTCREGGYVWRVDASRLFIGDLPDQDLTYSVDRLCPGKYIITPVYSPREDFCEWHGSWENTRGQVVIIEDASIEGFDFIFEARDSNSPRISSITVSPENPRMGEDAVITILAQDDGQIASIWEKTDTMFSDGSFSAGHWHSLTVSEEMLDSTAGAQFSLTDDRIMQATVRARVCDAGGNSHRAEMSVHFGSCDDGMQNQGETGVDCGGPCPSQCKNCLDDYAIGNGPSAYLYSPAQVEYLRGWALGALSEYANYLRINISEMDTSDEYIEAIGWWICTHMGYRGDDVNERVLNDVAGLDYHPSDYGHSSSDFPQPAYYTLNFSGQERTDPSKWFFGDCEDFAILTSALLRSLGVSHQCIFNSEEPGHGFNIVNYHSKYRIFEPQSNAMGCEYGPEFIWNDKIGAFGCSDFEKVHPWQYTMNYPGCENPSASVTGGGFGLKTLWLDWRGWGEHPALAAGDFDGDGRDDIAAVYNDYGTRQFVASVFPSTGHGFQPPPEALPEPYPAHPEVLVGQCTEGDFIVAYYIVHDRIHSFKEVEGTAAACPSSVIGYRPGDDADAVLLADPRGTGQDAVLEFTRGDSHKVRVNHTVWNSDFCPSQEIPRAGDFDGDGYDEAVAFSRSDSGGVRVIRSVPGQDKFTKFCLWHSEFCLRNQIPGAGDFNGDGRDDIVSFDQGNGDVFVGLSTVFGFWSDGFGETQSRWHDDFCSRDDTPIVGDFDGDGLDDIACFRINNGRVRVWVALAMPSTLTYDYHGGNPCQRANFYLDAYYPAICP